MSVLLRVMRTGWQPRETRRTNARMLRLTSNPLQSWLRNEKMCNSQDVSSEYKWSGTDQQLRLKFSAVN